MTTSFRFLFITIWQPYTRAENRLANFVLGTISLECKETESQCSTHIYYAQN